MKISVLLPYKENYSPTYSGAVSIFIHGVTKYSRHKENIRISYMNNSEKTIEGHELDIENSESIFNRTNLIKAVYVSIVK